MVGVVQWFEALGEVPLSPPVGLREYGPVADDRHRPNSGRADERVAGIAFAIEYCDARGWMSIRTIRCLTLDPLHPATIRADCHLRGHPQVFRLDRIIALMDYRTGRVLTPDDYYVLVGPFLADARMQPWIRPLYLAQSVARDGVFALLHLAMHDGRLGANAREVVLDYVQQEAAIAGAPAASPQLVKLWIDNLAPPLPEVSVAVTRLLADKARFTRLLPFIPRIVRCDDDNPISEDALRGLIDEVRTHFQNVAASWPAGLRATN